MEPIVKIRAFQKPKFSKIGLSLAGKLLKTCWGHLCIFSPKNSLYEPHYIYFFGYIVVKLIKLKLIFLTLEEK